jgi:hypothetical protein
MLPFQRSDQDYILAKAAQATGSTGWARDAHGFLAVDRSRQEPREVAVGVFQRFVGGEAEFHFAMLDGRFRRDVLDTFMWLAFHDRGAGLDKVWAIIPARNRLAQAAAVRAGFEFEYRKRAGMAGGEDAIVLSMSNPARAAARLSETE